MVTVQLLILLGGMAALFLIAGLVTGRCRHDWQLVDKTEMDSRFETLKKAGFSPEGLYPHQMRELTVKRVVLVLRCGKGTCGKSKIVTIDSA